MDLSLNSFQKESMSEKVDTKLGCVLVYKRTTMCMATASNGPVVHGRRPTPGAGKTIPGELKMRKVFLVEEVRDTVKDTVFYAWLRRGEYVKFRSRENEHLLRKWLNAVVHPRAEVLQADDRGNEDELDDSTPEEVSEVADTGSVLGDLSDKSDKITSG
eukprot:CAMPEP_0194539944 /NCGR_PEP_ID=MMETSP0253-20130528/80058_1 /TAXON_ID=2966 /ORGANISM="Noctiluca scintillans" /LENGTH=158 /DNA_ID=CAMNT_0039386269 /DNA_START=1 /DNA_END=474 /DNA_ORIENTATION=-